MESKDVIERQMSEKRKVKALIFDFGGVINTSLDSESWNQGFQDLGAKNKLNMAVEPFKSIIADYAEGKFPSDDSFLTKFRELLDMPTTVSNEAVIAAWNRQILGYNEESYKLVEFRKQFKMFALSNTNKMHRNFSEGAMYQKYLTEHSDKILPKSFRELFDKVYCSHEIFFRKPNLNAWTVILTENTLHPEECLFIDDVKEYCDAAVSLGMQAFQFDINKHSFDDVLKIVVEINTTIEPKNSNSSTVDGVVEFSATESFLPQYQGTKTPLSDLSKPEVSNLNLHNSNVNAATNLIELNTKNK